ncbi:acyltransferase family protein [Aliarcobacter butzleri]|uniref:acyltransferase family protein n=1 Tax=Aliarcobacter butzleri TaxID=28197 RepID=UPI00125FC213|nr:acyltransferase [Aliarcobacter butzleri]
MHSNTNQIKEIQSLRGISVILVVLYHFHIFGFSGGFVGVDMFFVISGFVITRQIYTQISDEKFSLSEFYIKRIKRLFPALFVTIFITYIVGYIIYNPNALSQLSKESLFSLFGIQNFFLLSQIGYFDVNSLRKTLLHTWSLSIEEQFYLFWPLFLLLIIKIKKNLLLVLVLIGIFASISLNIIFHKYDNFIFYMLPFRIYEFLFGTLAFLIYNRINNIKLFNHIFLSYFIILLLFILIFITEKTSISYIAIISFLTFILIIKSNGNKILTNSFLIYTGNISYSFYLVHWPILVFYTLYNLKTINDLLLSEKIILIFLSFLFSILLYRFIENKFRRHSFSSFRWKVLFIFLFIFLFLLSFTIIKKGIPDRYSGTVNSKFEYLNINHEEYRWKNFRNFQELKNYSYETFNSMENKMGTFSSQDKVKLLIIGDSQAGDFVNVLTETKIDTFELRTIPISAGCQSIILPLDNYIEFASKNTEIRKIDLPYCEKEHTYLWKSSAVRDADIIIIAAHYYPWAIKYLDNTIDFLKNINPKSKVYFIELKNQKYLIDDLVNKNILYNKLDEHSLRVNNLIKNNTNLKTIDINKFICNFEDNNCEIYTSSGYPIFYDKIHYTPKGAEFIGKNYEFKLMINQILNNE